MKSYWMLLMVLILALPASAREKAGVELPDEITIGDQSLVLNGVALRKKAIFKVYVAGLYLTEASSDADDILARDAAGRLEMVFVRSVGKDKIVGGWVEGLAKNVTAPSDVVVAGFERLYQWQTDIDDGASMRFDYQPGTGTEVTMAGELRGTIPGQEFWSSLLACFIGPDPGPGKKFRKQLLGLD